jgi:para-nitrobenzyl esterase
MRWKPPVPPSPWKKALNATSFGNVPAQHAPCFPGFSHESYTEDCLYLNVFAPEQHSDQALPVMALIPGGGLFCGNSGDYNPVDLVNQGKIVFVSINYRLGVFGFFSHPAINAEDHAIGNYGLMDQQLALSWVQENIAAFDGAPDNVTLMGESAGGASVMVHMASPWSTGLFHKAIVQSGGTPPSMQFDTTQAVEQKGVDLAVAAGCTVQKPSDLRKISTKDLIVANIDPPGSFGTGAFTIPLTEDGVIVPFHLRQRFSSGNFNMVPLLIGANRDEFAWFQAMVELSTGSIIPAEAYPEALVATLQKAAELRVLGLHLPPGAMREIISRYPLDLYHSAGRAISAVVGDAGAITTCTRRTARTIKRFMRDVFVYEFDVPDSPAAWPKVSFPYGSAHTQELQYLFPLFCGADGVANPLNESQQKLAKQMVTYWTTFARHGNPSVEDATSNPVVAWTPYRLEDDNVMLLCDQGPRMLDAWGVRHHSDFWDTFYEAI